MTNSQSLTTARLALRAVAPVDAGFVGGLLQDDRVRAFLGRAVAPAQLEQAVRANMTPAAGEDVWIVEMQADRLPVGLVSLGPHKDGRDVEISYQFHPEYWGHGYASEAVLAVLVYGREVRGLPRVIAETQSANHRSTRLLTALGMREVARLTRYGQPQTIFAT